MTVIDVSDLRATIVPKSDQLNADQVLGGPLTITVSSVRVRDGEQPVCIHYAGDNGRPYLPCKTMRKVLIHAWGADGRAWVGRSMTLYHDPSVRFGGELVGGIRISHMSDIPAVVKVSLAATRGKKALYEIRPLVTADAQMIADISAAQDLDALKAAFAKAYKATKDFQRRSAFKSAYDRRTAELSPSDELTRCLQQIAEAFNLDEAQGLVADAGLKPVEAEIANRAIADRFGGDE